MPETDTLLHEFAAYLQNERGVSARTASFYATDARHFAVWLGAQKPPRTLLLPDGVTHLLARRYLAEVGRGGRSETATRTVRRRITSLRALWAWLLQSKRATRDPLSAIEPPRALVIPAKVLNVGEVSRLLDSVNEDEPSALRDRALLELLYGSGARASEVVAMRLDDWDERAATARVGMGARERRVPLGREASRALRRYIERARPVLSKRANDKAQQRGHADRLWISQRGGALSEPLLYVMVRDRGRAVELEASPHALRRACAVHLLQAGASREAVAQLLGVGGVAALAGYVGEEASSAVTKRKQTRRVSVRNE